MGEFWGNFIQMYWPLMCLVAGVTVGIIIESPKVYRFLVDLHRHETLSAQLETLKDSLAQSEAARRSSRRVIEDMKASMAHMEANLKNYQVTLAALELAMNEREANERKLYEDVQALLTWGNVVRNIASDRTLPDWPPLHGLAPASDDSDDVSFEEVT